MGDRLPEYAVPGVENAFAPGSFCDRKYAAMREAYERLCHRLGAGDEDPDLEIIVDSLMDIQHFLTKTMFHLGTHSPLV